MGPRSQPRTSAGRRGRRPLQHNPQGFSLTQTSAAAWGQAALHPTLPYSVGRAFARNSFTPPCRGRACPARSLAITTPFTLCIVGRGLDPSAGRRGRRPLQHNPQGFSLTQTSAAAWGQAALHPTLPYSVGRAFARNSFTPPCRGRACPARSLAITTPFTLCIVGRGLDPSAGRRGRRPLQHNPQGFSLTQTSAAAWGQAALHPTLPHSVGRAFARNSFTPPCHYHPVSFAS